VAATCERASKGKKRKVPYLKEGGRGSSISRKTRDFCGSTNTEKKGEVRNKKVPRTGGKSRGTGTNYLIEKKREASGGGKLFALVKEKDIQIGSRREISHQPKKNSKDDSIRYLKGRIPWPGETR